MLRNYLGFAFVTLSPWPMCGIGIAPGPFVLVKKEFLCTGFSFMLRQKPKAVLGDCTYLSAIPRAVPVHVVLLCIRLIGELSQP